MRTRIVPRLLLQQDTPALPAYGRGCNTARAGADRAGIQEGLDGGGDFVLRIAVDRLPAGDVRAAGLKDHAVGVAGTAAVLIKDTREVFPPILATDRWLTAILRTCPDGTG